MSAQSDRIRAALQRSETARQSGEPRPDPAEQVKIAVNSENLAVLLGPKAPFDERPKAPFDERPKALAEEPKALSLPVAEPPAEVEATLPLIAASDQNRAGLPRFETVRPSIATSVEAPAAKFVPPGASGGPPTSGSRRILLAVVGLAIVGAGLAALLLRNHWSAPKQSAQIPSGLQMKVEPQSNGLINVRWNPQSELVTQAREGHLVISEPNQEPRVIALNPEQLRSGHVYYQSSADRIEFRLEVVNTAGATAQESVLALSSKSPAAPPVEAPPGAARAASAPTGIQNAQNVPNVVANADSAPVTEAPPPSQPSRLAARPYIPPQANQPSPGDASTISLDPPASVPAVAMIPAGVGLADRLNGVPAPQAIPQVVTPRISAGGNVQDAKLIKKVTPVYPALARATHAHGAVRFTATIGKDGRIKNLQLVSGNPTLVPPAADAVKQWVYQPTLLNGEPVEVITQIEVDFSVNP